MLWLNLSQSGLFQRQIIFDAAAVIFPEKRKNASVRTVVPHDTAALEFYLGKSDYIEDITVWFVPR